MGDKPIGRSGRNSEQYFGFEMIGCLITRIERALFSKLSLLIIDLLDAIASSSKRNSMGTAIAINLCSLGAKKKPSYHESKHFSTAWVNRIHRLSALSIEICRSGWISP